MGGFCRWSEHGSGGNEAVAGAGATRLLARLGGSLPSSYRPVPRTEAGPSDPSGAASSAPTSRAPRPAVSVGDVIAAVVRLIATDPDMPQPATTEHVGTPDMDAGTQSSDEDTMAATVQRVLGWQFDVRSST